MVKEIQRTEKIRICDNCNDIDKSAWYSGIFKKDLCYNCEKLERDLLRKNCSHVYCLYTSSMGIGVRCDKCSFYKEITVSKITYNDVIINEIIKLKP